jgi:SAM-dependent methyltransferase
LADAPDTLAHLDSQREVWNRKPLIRDLYAHYHELMLGQCAPGCVIEIGAGCGSLKSYDAGVISLDIVNSPWVDIVADAQGLPFGAESVDNFVMLDVLHHIPRPLLLLGEAERVLRPGGKLVMLEPGITPFSQFFYNHLHPEPVDMKADVFADQPLSSTDPFASNQAIPTLLFAKHEHTLVNRMDGLQVKHNEWLGPFSYPLSGGFRPWQLVTKRTLSILLKLERRLPPLLLKLLAFRLLTVMEKSH